ncbi:MAG: hypothetical protein H6Q20_1640 [Bacteroidetes bacterium]|jgi:hypothetical protein|nr:hypothetical protein [Bacteroidota bacterium]
MLEFQLYKKRNFSSFISDSIQFFKSYGKDYFKNYIIINGALLLVTCFLFYYTLKDIFANAMNPAFAESWIADSNNLVIIMILWGLLFLVSIVYSVLSLGQPLVYVKLIEKTGKESFTSSEILQGIWKITGRMVLYGIISMFIFFPLLIVLVVLGSLLSILLVGIPLLIIGVPAVMVWFMQALIVYLYEETGYFEALGKGWKILFGNFWHITGSSIVIYIFASILQSAISMVPYFMMVGSIISSGGNPESIAAFPPSMIFLYLIGIIVTYILINVFYVHQCLVYYSSIEDTEHLHAITEIDNIGNNEA